MNEDLLFGFLFFGIILGLTVAPAVMLRINAERVGWQLSFFYALLIEIFAVILTWVTVYILRSRLPLVIPDEFMCTIIKLSVAALTYYSVHFFGLYLSTLNNKHDQIPVLVLRKIVLHTIAVPVIMFLPLAFTHSAYSAAIFMVCVPFISRITNPYYKKAVFNKADQDE